jgi:hypothetical protein
MITGILLLAEQYPFFVDDGCLYDRQEVFRHFLVSANREPDGLHRVSALLHTFAERAAWTRSIFQQPLL